MGRTIFFTASSLDGFIATPEHSLDWLLTRAVDSSAGSQGYDGFIAGVGAMAMGSTTYRWVREHDHGPWPYAMPCWVLTHRTDLEPPDGGDVRFTAGPVPDLHARMVDAAGDADRWVVGGGGVAAQFAAAGLLDELWVQYAPVTLGAGVPLLPAHVELRLEDVERNGDFACARYTVVR